MRDLSRSRTASQVNKPQEARTATLLLCQQTCERSKDLGFFTLSNKQHVQACAFHTGPLDEFSTPRAGTLTFERP